MPDSPFKGLEDIPFKDNRVLIAALQVANGQRLTIEELLDIAIEHKETLLRRRAMRINPLKLEESKRTARNMILAEYRTSLPVFLQRYGSGKNVIELDGVCCFVEQDGNKLYLLPDVLDEPAAIDSLKIDALFESGKPLTGVRAILSALLLNYGTYQEVSDIASTIRQSMPIEFQNYEATHIRTGGQARHAPTPHGAIKRFNSEVGTTLNRRIFPNFQEGKNTIEYQGRYYHVTRTDHPTSYFVKETHDVSEIETPTSLNQVKGLGQFTTAPFGRSTNNLVPSSSQPESAPEELQKPYSSASSISDTSFNKQEHDSKIKDHLGESMETIVETFAQIPDAGWRTIHEISGMLITQNRLRYLEIERKHQDERAAESELNSKLGVFMATKFMDKYQFGASSILVRGVEYNAEREEDPVRYRITRKANIVMRSSQQQPQAIVKQEEHQYSFNEYEFDHENNICAALERNASAKTASQLFDILCVVNAELYHKLDDLNVKYRTGELAGVGHIDLDEYLTQLIQKKCDQLLTQGAIDATHTAQGRSYVLVRKQPVVANVPPAVTPEEPVSLAMSEVQSSSFEQVEEVTATPELAVVETQPTPGLEPVDEPVISVVTEATKPEVSNVTSSNVQPSIEVNDEALQPAMSLFIPSMVTLDDLRTINALEDGHPIKNHFETVRSIFYILCKKTKAEYVGLSTGNFLNDVVSGKYLKDADAEFLDFHVQINGDADLMFEFKQELSEQQLANAGMFLKIQKMKLGTVNSTGDYMSDLLKLNKC